MDGFNRINVVEERVSELEYLILRIQMSPCSMWDDTIQELIVSTEGVNYSSQPASSWAL